MTASGAWRDWGAYSFWWAIVVKQHQWCNTQEGVSELSLKLQFVPLCVSTVCRFLVHTAEIGECECLPLCMSVVGCWVGSMWRPVCDYKWCTRVFLLSVEGVEKHLFNLVYNWIWPMGMQHSSERWQQMKGDEKKWWREGEGDKWGHGRGRERRKRRWRTDEGWEAV